MLHLVDGELDGCTSRLQINDVLVVAIGKTTNISLENHGIYDAVLASSGSNHQSTKKMKPVIKLQAPCHQTTSPVMSDAAISDLEDQVYQRWQGIENHTPCQLCCYQFLLN